LGGSFAGGWTVDVAKQSIYTAVSGNVGIGTSNPTQKLYIKNGNIFVENGSVYADIIEVGNNLFVNGNGIFRGSIGIGTEDPQAMLDINGRARTLDGYEIGDGNKGIYVVNNEVVLWHGAARLAVTQYGKVKIGDKTPGTPDNNYELAVYGKIVGTEVVSSAPANWADYVFATDYELMNLADVNKFIKTNKHLPGVPSEREVKTKGINMAEMDALLLKKIEELTLYMIQQQNEINELKENLK